jgi:hypothetical protein
MLTDNQILYVKGNDNAKGVALCWVIDGQALYDYPIWEEYKEMFTSYDEIIDISEEYPDHDGITVRFIKNRQVVNELKTSEYFGSILLSYPLVVDLFDYQYGRYVVSPHALFDGEKFTITNRDMTDILPWHPSHPRASENDQV